MMSHCFLTYLWEIKKKNSIIIILMTFTNLMHLVYSTRIEQYSLCECGFARINVCWNTNISDSLQSFMFSILHIWRKCLEYKKFGYDRCRQCQLKHGLLSHIVWWWNLLHFAGCFNSNSITVNRILFFVF